MGFEPVTCCLRNSCSTAELRRRTKAPAPRTPPQRSRRRLLPEDLMRSAALPPEKLTILCGDRLG